MRKLIWLFVLMLVPSLKAQVSKPVPTRYRLNHRHALWESLPDHAGAHWGGQYCARQQRHGYDLCADCDGF